MSAKIVVFDYGSGNLRSAERAMARTGAEVVVTADRDEALAADGLVVPGVGAYAACMAGLVEVGGREVIAERIAGSAAPAGHLRRPPGAVRGRHRARRAYIRLRRLAGRGRAGAGRCGCRTWAGTRCPRRPTQGCSLESRTSGSTSCTRTRCAT